MVFITETDCVYCAVRTESTDVTDVNFYVLLTVHLSISLDNDQLDTHLLYFKYVH